MKKLIITAAVAATMLVPAAVQAADFTASDAGEVTFSANLGNPGNSVFDQYFSYRVEDPNGNVCNYGQVTSTDGNVSFNFGIKGDTGEYKLIVSNRKLGKKTYSISYVNNIYIEFNEIKGYNDASDMNTFLRDSGAYFGFDTTAYKALSSTEQSKIVNYMLSCADATSVEDLKTKVAGANVTDSVFTTTDASTVQKYINDSVGTEGQLFNTAVAEVYKNDLNAENQLKIAGELMNSGMTSAKMADFELSVLKARVGQIKYWADMEEVILSTGNVWGFKANDLSLYDYSCDKEAVCRGMISGINSITSIEQYRALLSTLIAANPSTGTSTANPNGTGSAIVGSGDIIVNFKGGELSPYPTDYELDEATIISQTTADFKDLAGYEWAETAIKKLIQNYIVSGITSSEYAPQNNITREQFAKMITAGLRLTGAEAVSTFGDVETDTWYYTYVAAAQRAGIVSGDENNNFGVGQNITRQDAAVMVSRAMSVAGVTLEMGEAPNFTDEAEISSYAKTAVINMAKAGVITGRTDGSFDPKSSITRAEAAQMLYSCFSKAGLLKW